MRLRNLFSDTEVQQAIESTGSFAEMAEVLSRLGRGEISRQLATYWAKQFDIRKKNGDTYLTMTVPNRKLKEARVLRTPSVLDTLATAPQGLDTRRILFITDTHAPYHHPDTLAFLNTVKHRYKPTMVVHGGDEVDNHALSFHNSDPNLDAAGAELDRARAFISELHDLFPCMRLCESNHGSLIYRRAKAHGIPVQYIRTYREILFPDGGGEQWSWHARLRIEMPHGKDLQFQHSCSGDLLKGAAHHNSNLLVGHEHAKFGVGYGASDDFTYYSVYGGCLLDIDSMAFAYGKLYPNRPIVGVVLIIDGVPQCIPMQLSADNRWVGYV